jgi:hypothetical protein
MYIVAIAWLYVAVMMSVAEATHSAGTLVGAFFTFVLYGALPVSLVLYLMGAPARKRAIRAREAADHLARRRTAESGAPDGGGTAPAAAVVAPVRKEP